MKTISNIPAQRGSLYLVATPIGNLEDITLRAIRILKESAGIACEDTRHTQKLLNHHGIQNRLISYHEHNENTRAPELVAEMENGASIALVSDAGTPVISDPGYRLINLCIERDISVIPIPGPSSALAALAGSGISAERFLFAGFLPARQGERRRALAGLTDYTCTLIFFEAPHRIAKTLADAADILGPRQAALGREITKIHEEFLRGTLGELASRATKSTLRGEMTLVVAAGTPETVHPPENLTLHQRFAQLIQEGNMDRKAALKQTAREFGIARREAYKQLLLDEGLPDSSKQK